MLGEKNAQEHLYGLHLSYLVFVNCGKEMLIFYSKHFEVWSGKRQERNVFCSFLYHNWDGVATQIFINYNIAGDIAPYILEAGEDNLSVF
jgi:hypothetical protein